MNDRTEEIINRMLLAAVVVALIGLAGVIVDTTKYRQAIADHEAEQVPAGVQGATTGECLMAFAVVRELTGTQKDDLDATVAAVRTAVGALAPQRDASAGEPAFWQVRMRPSWSKTWDAWRECSAEAAADYQRAGTLHEWVYETRAFYLAPQPMSAQPTAELKRFLDGAAGDGLVCGGVDAADLYCALFGAPQPQPPHQEQS